MMTDEREDALIRLRDLQKQSERRHMHEESFFLNEEELASVQSEFPESALIRYDGGYEGARKKKVIFLRDEEDGFSDIVCLKAETDQRFRTIGHRDILGSLMSLQIDRHSFGDFWMEENCIYLYTSDQMGRFLEDNLTRISRLNVSFHRIEEHPVQVFYTKKVDAVIASERLDAIVASLAHCSRNEAKEMIRQGKVQINHRVLEAPDKMCDNGNTISIRGTGHFTYQGVRNHTKKDRIVAEFLQDIQGKERSS